jgi:hypothetical protein
LADRSDAPLEYPENAPEPVPDRSAVARWVEPVPRAAAVEPAVCVLDLVVAPDSTLARAVPARS